jgi:pyrroloquinoline quinone (PQQ) biosynthesis protein C
MNVYATLEAEWSACYDKLKNGDFLRALADRTLTRGQYSWFLRECYHNVYLNPKLMALFITHSRSGKFQTEAKLLRHAAMEIGHHELALNDFVALGGDAEELRASRPLPTTEAMAAFIAFQIQHRDPMALLGYMFHLEALPVRAGHDAGAALAAIGIPAGAMTFLMEHAEVDTVHMKWEREYMERFIATPSDLEAVVYGLRGTAELHGIMLQAVMDKGRDWSAVPAPRAPSLETRKA